MYNLSDAYKHYNVQQKDRGRYENITQAGSRNYVLENFSNPSPEDIATLARIITQLRTVIETEGQVLVRHIDVGTGTSPIPLFSFPFVDEIVCIERSPANIDVMETWLRDTQPPVHLRTWQEIAGILYAINGEVGLKRLLTEQQDLVTCLKNWPKLATTNKMQILQNLVPDLQSNPYLSVDLQTTLRKKVRFVKGDILEGVNGDKTLGLDDLRPYVKTADYLTMFSCAESISADLLVVAHVLVNWSYLGKPGAHIFQQSMAQTMGYDSFFTPQEKGLNAPLEECYITSRLFHELLSHISYLNKGWDQTIVFDSTHPLANPVRLGYGGMTGFRGMLPAGQTNLYKDGGELLHALKNDLYEVKISSKDQSRSGYCLAHETEVVKEDLMHAYQGSLAKSGPVLLESHFGRN